MWLLYLECGGMTPPSIRPVTTVSSVETAYNGVQWHRMSHIEWVLHMGVLFLIDGGRCRATALQKSLLHQCPALFLDVAVPAIDGCSPLAGRVDWGVFVLQAGVPLNVEEVVFLVCFL